MMRHHILFTAFALIGISLAASAQENQYDTLKQAERHQRIYPKGQFEAPVVVVPPVPGVDRYRVSNPKLMGRWEELGPVNTPEGKQVKLIGTGRLNVVQMQPGHPENMYVCSPSGGVFYSRDSGKSWQHGKGGDFLPVAGAAYLAINPDKPNEWVQATGDGDGNFVPSVGIYYTTDAGNTYHDLSLGLPMPTESWDKLHIHKLVADPTNFNRLFAATNKGLYSMNNWQAPGATWVGMITGEVINEIEFMPTRPDFMLAGGKKIYASHNHGARWKQMKGTEFTQIGYEDTRVNIEVSPADPSVIYVGVAGRDPGKGFFKSKLYRFDGRTGNWEDKGLIKDRSYLPYGLIPARVKAFAVNPVDASHLVAGNVNPCWESRDGGTTWTVLPTGIHDDVHHFQFSPDGSALWATTDGGVHVSFDDGQTWENRTIGIGVANVHVASSSEQNPGRALIGCYDTGSSLLIDGDPTNWKSLTGGDGYSNMIDPRNDSIMYTTNTGGGVYRTDNGWKRQRGAAAPRSGSDWQTWITLNPINPDVIYMAGSTVWRSSMMGNNGTWEKTLDIATDFAGAHKVLRIYPAPTDENVVYALLVGGGPARVIRTHNAQAPAEKVRWEEIPHPEDQWVIDIDVDDENPDAFWLAYSKAGDGFASKVHYYDGKRWENLNRDLPDFLKVNSIVHQHGSSNRVYVGTNHGVFVADGISKRWRWLYGLPHCTTLSLKINYASQKLVAGTFGRGLWQCPVMPISRRTVAPKDAVKH